MLQYLLVALLALWLFASLLAQLTSWEGAPKPLAALSEWFRARDPLSLIPAWNFFAPNPGTTDYHLLYRDKLDSGEVSLWREIPIEKEPTMLKGIWNPHKRKSKVLSDVIGIVNQSLAAAHNRAVERAGAEVDDSAEELDEQALEKRVTELVRADLRWLQVSIPYLLILNYLSHIEHPVFSSATQFLFAETRAYDRSVEPRILFVSEFHDLP
ncbi:MAG: hypothetical protein H6509_07465 [Bryobacterales bacterium]|nr:hypothetical protein [Acidobacteriota bacterium]MCB9384436.1 hypothetical protein [Bryobacterales bacterium]